ncbi:ABC transporter permease [Haloplasma contractile]|uniref:ABC-2 type transporter protein n=1 Tax=Haloplasma contractile SSD-17B TaxID=1033810 RepID=U2FEK0_9MOLU|nr:ABC transporter permease [Haloplasma contractile]ERJ11375.1 ABC-2 type transporter protein [Haloplasma contractile SSD-17B]
MQAFKLFYKIVPRKFLGVFIIYTIIFVGLMTFFTKSGFTQGDDVFELSEVKVSVINNDNSTLANGLERYINDISKPVEIKTDEESMKDALFFRETEFIVIIPEGFENKFTASDQQVIQTMSVPDSASSEYAKTIIDRYLNTAKVYVLAEPEMSIQEINDMVLNDLSMKATVSLYDHVQSNNLSSLNTYFNFLSYILLAMLISMIGRIMLIFNNKDIKMRNYCAPLSSNRYNYQLIFSNLLLAFIVWIIFVILSFIVTNATLLQTSSFLFIVNSLVLTIVCISISFLVSSFATKKSIDPIGNCISLGLSFLGGSFVPQVLLSDYLKTIGTFNPIFWYVRVNDTIASTGNTYSTLEPIIYGILVQLAFAAALLAISLVIIKQKRQAH